MRKQTKLVAVLSATALLAIGASAAAFAAGWDNSTGAWQYLDNDGIPVYNEWKKSGNDWFYLGDDGYMVTDSIVEDNSSSSTKYYYVNETGAMVSNTWMTVANEDGDWDCDYFWYYFGADGKAYTSSGELTPSKMKTINGKKYAFTEEGKMLYGWVAQNDATVSSDETVWQTANYYFGDMNDGALRTGWQQLTVEDSDGDTSTDWFYFDSYGKKVAANAGDLKTKSVDGKSYVFNEHGQMVDDWAAASGNTITATSNVLYTNGDGAVRKNTWIWAVPAEDQIADNEAYDNGDANWWYADYNGELVKDKIKKINGKRYAFNSDAQMLTGLVTATGTSTSASNVAELDLNENTGEELITTTLPGTLFYFSSSEDDGSMKTGYQTVEFDDYNYQMYFKTTGEAENGYVNKIKKFVSNGIVLKANSDYSNYAAVKVAANGTKYDWTMVDNQVPAYLGDIDDDGTWVLVNLSGTPMLNKTNIKDINDWYYCTDENGYVTYVNSVKGEKQANGTWAPEV